MDLPWYNHHLAQQPSPSVRRLPSLLLQRARDEAQAGSAIDPSSRLVGASGPREIAGDVTPAASDQNSSSPGLVEGCAPVAHPIVPPPLTPPDEPSCGVSQQQTGLSYPPGDEAYGQQIMDHASSYMDVHQSHMSTGHRPQSSTATAGNVNHYAQYGQPPLLQPGPSAYPSTQATYGQYQYAMGVNSSPGAGLAGSAPSVAPQVPSQLLPLPGESHPDRRIVDGELTCASAMAPGAPPHSSASQAAQGYPPQPFDTTGQMAPPGMKPRVTATLWEDEGCLCFQVEAKGICVARREGRSPRDLAPVGASVPRSPPTVSTC